MAEYIGSRPVLKEYIGSRLVIAEYLGSLALAGGADPYMFASNRAQLLTGTFAATAGTQYRTDILHYKSPPYAVTSPRFCFPNFLVSQALPLEKAIANSVLYQGVSIEVAGVRTPLAMNGGVASDLTVSSTGYFWTDENSVTIPPNTIFGVIVSTYVPTGSVRPYGTRTLSMMGDGQVSGSTTQTAYLTGSTPITVTDQALSVAPCFIVAKGWSTAGMPPVPMIVGDSISVSGNDAVLTNQDDGVYCYLAKGLNDGASSTRYAYGHIGLVGTTALDFNAVQFVIRKQMLLDVNADGPFTHIFSEMGVNDGAGATKANSIAYAAYLKSLWPTRKIVQCTLSPRPTLVTANIGYTTAANQVSSYGSGAGSWGDFYDYLKGQGAYSGLPANIDAVIDVRPAFESSPGSGKFVCSGWNTTLAVDYVSNATTCSLVAAPTVGMALMGGVGGVGGALKALGVVKSVTGAGPYTVTLQGQLTGALTAPSSIWEVDCDSVGLHPYTFAHNRARDVVIAAKNAGVFA